MTFRTAILAMRLNRKRLVVVLESELYIYDISNMQMLRTEKTSPNPNGKQDTFTPLSTLTDHSHMRPFRLLREQLPHLPSPHQSCTRYLPASVPCATQIGSHSSDQRRNPDI